MNILNQQVFNKKYGMGTVVKQTDEYVFIKFANGEKKFQYPMAFQKILALNNETLREEILKEIMQKEQEKEQYKSEIKKDIFINKNLNNSNNSEKLKDPQDRHNIAFKCNYCDGGKSDKLMGFNGVCSDKMIRYNIKVEKNVWCSLQKCMCSKYFQKKISRHTLESRFNHGGFVCNESKMLKDWKAMAGFKHNGVHKGRPMHLKNVGVNSLCVLTTRKPNTKEDERIIFAVFLIDRSYEGDDSEEGFVSTQSRFKLALSPKEAEKMPFWKYHANKNKAEKAFWGSGLHRYITNAQAVQILSDIAKLKKGTKDEALAQEFLAVFCEIVNMSVEEAGSPEGVLMKRNF